MEGHILSCTFCKRSERQVRKLVAGPGVYICDRCTERAHAIIKEADLPPAQGSTWRRVTGQLRRLVSRSPGRLERRRAKAHEV
jgi:hypothetical protein